MATMVWNYVNSLWSLVLEMAPWLLLGFLFAGLLKVYYPQKSLEKHMGKPSLGSIIRATLIGIPLPLCSCGVIPTGISFYRNGASKPATNAFLISTPQTGIDSIFATYALMGFPFAIIRPIMALCTGIFGGMVTLFVTKKENIQKEKASGAGETCGVPLSNKTARWEQVLHYGFVEMMADIAKWLVIGLLLAALITTLVPEGFFVDYLDNFWWQLLAVLAISVPLYVCATGSIPIAAALLSKGLSPAVAILFLMAGPATNVVTVTVLGKTMGKRSVLAYLGSIIGGGVLFTLGIHYFVPQEWFLNALPGLHHGSHQLFPQWLSVGMGILLLALLAYALLKPYFRKSNPNFPINSNTMETQTIQVKGMTCNHCTGSVERNVAQLEGVTAVRADLQTGTTVIEGHPNMEQVKKTIEGLGYSVSAS